MTHTEKVHVIFGIMAATAGGLALWHAYRPRSRVGLIWPILTVVIGLGLFIPVEAQTRTYVEVSWWGTILSVVPDSPQYWLDNWFSTLATWHVLQHKAGGLMIIVVGIVEWQRARGRLAKSLWRHSLPVLLVAIGLSFGLHGGGAAHLPTRTETLHHQIFGVAFLLAGVTKGLVDTGRLKPSWRGLWAALILVVGLDIALFYRLDPGELPTQGHQHESTGPRMR